MVVTSPLPMRVEFMIFIIKTKSIYTIICVEYQCSLTLSSSYAKFNDLQNFYFYSKYFISGTLIYIKIVLHISLGLSIRVTI